MGIDIITISEINPSERRHLFCTEHKRFLTEAVQTSAELKEQLHHYNAVIEPRVFSYPGYETSSLCELIDEDIETMAFHSGYRVATPQTKDRNILEITGPGTNKISPLSIKIGYTRIFEVPIPFDPSDQYFEDQLYKISKTLSAGINLYMNCVLEPLMEEYRTTGHLVVLRALDFYDQPLIPSLFDKTIVSGEDVVRLRLAQSYQMNMVFI